MASSCWSFSAPNRANFARIVADRFQLCTRSIELSCAHLSGYGRFPLCNVRSVRADYHRVPINPQVLADIVSCWCFLLLYPVGTVLLFLLGVVEWAWGKTDYRHQADSHENDYGVMEQDLSFFDAIPHSASNVMRVRPYSGKTGALSQGKSI